MKAGCHSFHLFVSVIREKIESFGAYRLMAFEIRIWDGISNDMAVPRRKIKTMLMSPSLISRT
jgi:hypothetical protein